MEGAAALDTPDAPAAFAAGVGCRATLPELDRSRVMTVSQGAAVAGTALSARPREAEAGVVGPGGRAARACGDSVDSLAAGRQCGIGEAAGEATCVA